MKKLLVVTVVAACGGDGDNTKNNNGGVDAGVDSAVVMPDAPSPIEGRWKDTYYAISGSSTSNGCLVAPAAVKVDPTSAAVNLYPGTCKSDGSFTIDAPVILDDYYLKVAGTLYETDRRSGLDLSFDRLGRSGVSPVTGVTLGINVNNLQPWTSADQLVAFAWNIGYRQNLSFTSGAPSPGATTITGVAGWSGYQVDNTKSDQLQIMQLGKHTTGTSVDYLTLDRAYYAPGFAMSSNTQQSLGGSFTTPAAATLAFKVDVASFNQFESIVAPDVTSKSAQGVAFAAVSTDVPESPALFSFIQPADAAATLDFGTVSMGDPFPAAWKRMVRVQVSNLASFTYNGHTGTMTAVVGRLMTKGAAEAGTIDAKLGPVTNVKFDDSDADGATSISAVPLLSWSAPTLGTPTDYEIQVYEAVSSGASTLSFTSVLRLVTTSTSVRIPEGYLLGQRQYLFQIRARNREGVDLATTPLHVGSQWSVADHFTGIVTTGS